MDAYPHDIMTEFLGLPHSQRTFPSDVWQIVLPFLAEPKHEGSLGRLGHYEILEVLGQGGFGIVVKALDEKLQRHVAIKILSPLLAATSPPRKFFLREARSAAKVQHENVVGIYAVEEFPLPYLVMEYIAGQTLQQRIDVAGPLEPAEIVRLGRQMALGLAAAHAQGLVHRDIKPANIMLEGDGNKSRVKITDFGIARTADDASMTHTGFIIGTPMYMSPEQANGDPVDARSDLFSLGSVLYTMTCGRPPFRAGTGLSVLRRVSEDAPRAIREINPDAPLGLCAVIKTLHSKNPQGRFASATDAAEQIATCLQPPVATRPWRSGAVLAACVTLMAFTAGFAVRGRQTVYSHEPLALIVEAPAVAAEIPPAIPPAEIPAAIPVPAAIQAAPAAKEPITDRDAWASLLASVSGEEKARLLFERLKRDHARLDTSMVQIKVENNDITEVLLTEAVCFDLEPFAALPKLRSLWMPASNIKTFEPLRGLKLEQLQCDYTSAEDLSPLRCMPLKRLSIWCWRGSDLSPLEGLPLEYLNCGFSAVDDLSPLRGMPLKFVCINHTKVSDISALAGMKLDELLVENTMVKDISIVREMPLKVLTIRNSRVVDVEPIRGLPLNHLLIDYNHGRHQELLESLTSLTRVNSTPLPDFLANMR